MEIKGKINVFTDIISVCYFSKGINICQTDNITSFCVLPKELDDGTFFCDMIEGMGYKLYSQFDLSSTIFPGRRRTVKNYATGREIYGIVYRNSNLYNIIGDDFQIEVTVNEKGYFFSYCGNDIAILVREDDNNFRGGFFDDTLDALIIVAVLSFPSLKFAL